QTFRRDPVRCPDEFLEIERIAKRNAGLFDKLARSGVAHRVQVSSPAAPDILILEPAAGKRPDVGSETAPLVAPKHEDFERIVAHQDDARRGQRRYFCHPTHSTPSGPRSFFQIGTVCLKRSITCRHASKASPRWGEAHAMTIDGSPMRRRPRR